MEGGGSRCAPRRREPLRDHRRRAARDAGADVFVVPLVDGRRPRSWEEAGRLLLAVEVISPSTARRDRVAKRWLYQRQAVPEYWIVDVDAALVERWQPGDERPEILSDRIDWQPLPGAAVLSIDLVAYFHEVAGTGTRG